MMVSKYGFTDLVSNGVLLNGSRGADAARIAAGVVTGISFLGAGVIFKNGNSIRGLTTASGIWATATVGMSIGAGMIAPGLLLLIVVMAVQIIFHRYSIGSDVFSEMDAFVTMKANSNLRDTLNSMIEKKQIQVTSFTAVRPLNDDELFQSLSDITSISIN